MRIGYAGDRQISVDILSFILNQNIKPLILIVPDTASHSDNLIAMCNYLDNNYIIKGSMLKDNIDKIKNLELDYLICIHFPMIIPQEILDSVKFGVLNLHPAYLPYNRGWHTSTWSILEDTPYGATLHFMDKSIDTGDIINQKKIIKLPTDTGDTLYKKALELEKNLFQESWLNIINNKITRIPQQIHQGTFHKKQDITPIQHLNLNKIVKTEDFILLLKALTTNTLNDAAYFIKDGVKYYIQIKITDSRKV